MSNEKKLVPELRFIEFKDDTQWVEKKIGQLGEVVVGGTPSTTVEDYWNGDIGWIGSGELKNDIIKKPTRYITELGLEKSSTRLLPKGTAVLAMTGATLGKIGLLDFACCGNQSVAGFVNLKGLSSTFLFYHLQKITKQILSFAGGGAQAGINKYNIENLTIHVPNLGEQKKIASCISSLDGLIIAYRDKQEALKAHKNGLMQNIFPQKGENLPKYRLPEFERDGNWVEKSLKDVASFSKGKGISKSDIAKDGNLPCIRYGELYTDYNETISTIKSRTNLDAKDLVLSQQNDVIIPASGETQIDIATASCVLEKGVALGGDLNIIRTKINGVFLSYYLNNVKKKDIAQMAQGISVVHLYANQLQTLQIKIPQPEEQRQIASLLSNIDELITTQGQKIKQLQLHKKGLMQQLFPKAI